MSYCLTPYNCQKTLKKDKTSNSELNKWINGLHGKVTIVKLSISMIFNFNSKNFKWFSVVIYSVTCSCACYKDQLAIPPHHFVKTTHCSS